jgi:hypothetical protein
MPTHEAPGRLNSAAKTFLILIIGACGMATLLALLPAAGHDQMWLLYAARLVHHGAPLYGPQVFETNPPLIIWLSMVPEALSGFTHIPDTTLGKLFVAALELGIGALCLRLLRLTRFRLSTDATYGLAFVFVTAFAVMPARDFGQRDHFLVLFIVPYVFAAAVRAEDLPLPAWLGWLTGSLALLGIVLKPHQILVPIAVESALLAMRKAGASKPSLPRHLLRPEILAMFSSGIIFLIALHNFAPFYFSVVTPLARDTYWAYGKLTLPQLLGESIQLHLLAILDFALLITLGWRNVPAITRVLLVAGSASTLAFYLQSTGWYYQQLPALSFFSLALAFLILQFNRQRNLRIPPWSPTAAATLTLLALALTTHFMGYPFTAERSFPLDTPDPSFFAGLPPGTPVMTISPTIDDTIMPIFKYRLTLGQRYPAFLMLPAILRSEDPHGKHLRHTIPPARLAELDRIQHEDMREDLLRWQPQLLLIERCQDPAVHCQVLEDRHDDLLAFFLRDPAFAQLFTHYHFVRTSGPYDAYAFTP